MAPRTQYRRAMPERARTGTSNQLRAKAPLHQLRSSPTRSRARLRTARVLVTLCAARLSYPAGLGFGLGCLRLKPSRSLSALRGVESSIIGAQSKGIAFLRGDTAKH